MSGLKLKRLGMIMEPESGNPLEAEGVLNPGVIRGPDGKLYLFPRMVAKGNYSRIGISRVLFDDKGEPIGVERLGIALEPEADYELGSDGRGGCEDPRVTYMEPLQCYMMTYTALSADGPRPALAVSNDLFHWKRIGLLTFSPFQGIDFVNVDDKDTTFFPVAIPNHAGKMQMAILHRPLFPGTTPEETIHLSSQRVLDIYHESIWISYAPMMKDKMEPHFTGLFNSHHRLASPVSPWERLKIGCGTPPIMTRHGWLIIYHGVSKIVEQDNGENQLCYSAGIMILNKEHPQIIHYRSKEAVLSPELPQERHGVISNVVFPTGIDRRDDLGLPDRYDVYYGMADNRIGVARFDLPDILPPEFVVDSALV